MPQSWMVADLNPARCMDICQLVTMQTHKEGAYVVRRLLSALIPIWIVPERTW